MNIPLNIDWQQIVLHLMNFAILAGGLYFLLYNPVKKFMAKRAEYYENMDKEANEKLESATIKEAEYQKHMEELEAELDAKRKEAAKQADTMIQQSVNQAKEQAAKVMSDAKAAAMQERTKNSGWRRTGNRSDGNGCNRKDSCRQCITERAA